MMRESNVPSHPHANQTIAEIVSPQITFTTSEVAQSVQDSWSNAGFWDEFSGRIRQDPGSTMPPLMGFSAQPIDRMLWGLRQRGATPEPYDAYGSGADLWVVENIVLVGCHDGTVIVHRERADEVIAKLSESGALTESGETDGEESG